MATKEENEGEHATLLSLFKHPGWALVMKGLQQASAVAAGEAMLPGKSLDGLVELEYKKGVALGIQFSRGWAASRVGDLELTLGKRREED